MVIEEELKKTCPWKGEEEEGRSRAFSSKPHSTKSVGESSKGVKNMKRKETNQPKRCSKKRKSSVISKLQQEEEEDDLIELNDSEEGDDLSNKTHPIPCFNSGKDKDLRGSEDSDGGSGRDDSSSLSLEEIGVEYGTKEAEQEDGDNTEVSEAEDSDGSTLRTSSSSSLLFSSDDEEEEEDGEDSEEEEDLFSEDGDDTEDEDDSFSENEDETPRRRSKKTRGSSLNFATCRKRNLRFARSSSVESISEDEDENRFKKRRVSKSTDWGKAPKGDLFKLFVNTIWEKGGRNIRQQEESVPQVEPVKKTDYEKFVEPFWDVLDFHMRSTKIGSFGFSMVEAKNLDEPNVPNVPGDPSSFCYKGKHEFILDEQIGIKCKLCPFVKMKIKYTVPRAERCQYERSARKNRANDESFSMWEASNAQDDEGTSLGSYDDFDGNVWDMFPRIKENMYPHQQEGFEFLWRNIAGGFEIEKLKKFSNSDSIGGCVISHAPGTGKTLLTIAFLQSYMQVFKECRALILAPASMLLTWEEEFKKWKAKTPFFNLSNQELSGAEDKIACQLIPGKIRDSKWIRMVKLLSWSKQRSIMGISYPLFEKLAGERQKKGEERKVGRGDGFLDEADEIRKILVEKPTLMVFDEGHTPRNKRSHIWKTLQNIKTERRIILSGTPFQNNFEELKSTLSLARPNFLDSIEDRDIWTSLTSSIGINADDGLLEQIRAMIAPFVHVHKGSILKENLPGLRDWMVVLNPPPLQKELLEQVNNIKEQKNFEQEHAVSLVSIHPSLFEKCGCFRIENSVGYEIGSKGFKLDEITSKEFKLDPRHGVKTRFLMELLRLAEAKNEKVLVFSQYIDPFYLIKNQLNRHFNWRVGEEVLWMDGTDHVKDRQYKINFFNDPSSNVRVLLASTRACSEGINLVGASRIVLLDVVWNPSVERQAVSRAYRLGQKKLVYTYHLITSMEVKKYLKQLSKDRLSELVFSSTHGHDGKQKGPSAMQDDAILEEMVGSEKLQDMFDEIKYQPKESLLVDTYF